MGIVSKGITDPGFSDFPEEELTGQNWKSKWQQTGRQPCLGPTTTPHSQCPHNTLLNSTSDFSDLSGSLTNIIPQMLQGYLPLFPRPCLTFALMTHESDLRESRQWSQIGLTTMVFFLCLFIYLLERQKEHFLELIQSPNAQRPELKP